MKNELPIILGIPAAVAVVAILGYIYFPTKDNEYSIKEPRSANDRVSNYRKGVIDNYYREKYPDASGGSKRKKIKQNKTKKIIKR